MIDFVGVPDRVMAGLLSRVGEDIDGILDTTRDMVRGEIERGLSEGVGAAELGDMIESAAAFDEYRAETIARTETAMLLNRAAAESYRAFGITHVRIIDGDDDAECREADGQIWTLEEYEANPIAHPNCVRDAAPVVGEAVTVPDEPSGMSEEERQGRVFYEGSARLGIAPDHDYVGVDGYGLPRGAEERIAFAKDRGIETYEVLARDGKMDEAVEAMQFAWTDGAHTPISALTQSTLAEQSQPGMIWSGGSKLFEVSDEARSVVSETYARTQAGLANGPDTFTVYRGIKSDLTTHNVLESWSTERELAERFDGHAVLKATVSREDVFMDLRDVSEYERELTVLGGRVQTVEVLPGTGQPSVGFQGLE